MATIATDADRFPTATKESGASAARTPDQRPQPDSVLASIPVVVHATHRSAASSEASPVQKVREETDTVIVFPTGAVVGLSSVLSRGDLVVLTNRQNRADILCRVVFAWAPAEGQSYVELEFAQRAPGFWEPAAAPAKLGPGTSKAEAAVTAAVTPLTIAPTATPTIAPAIAPVLTFRPIAKAPAPVAPNHVEAPLPQPAVTLPGSEPTAPEPWGAPSNASSTDGVADLRAAVAAADADRAPGYSARATSKEPADARLGILEHGSSPVESTGLLTAKLKALSHRPALWVIAACLTVAALSAEVYLAGHRGSTNPVAEATSVQRAYPVQPASALASEALAYTQAHPAAPGSPAAVASAPAVRAPEAAADHGETTADEAEPRRGATIRVGKLTAPIGKSARNGAPSEPPVMSAQANAVESLLATGSYATTAVPPAPAAAVPAANPPARGGSYFEGPKIVSSMAPVYPPFARTQGLEGVVVIDVLIDATGSVAEAKIVSGPLLLRQAALDAVRRWKYQPAKLDGQVIADHQTVNVDFKRN